MSRAPRVLAIDAGGTMTDTFIVDETGAFVVGKAQSTPDDESRGLMFAESMRLGPAWAAEDRGFWDLPEDFDFDVVCPTVTVERPEPGKTSPAESVAAFLAGSDPTIPEGEQDVPVTTTMIVETPGDMLDEKLSRRTVKDIKSAIKDRPLRQVAAGAAGALYREIYPVLGHPEGAWQELREFYCPISGHLLETEAVPPGYSVVHNYLPDLEGFYRGWLRQEILS